ncbi:hypothetical protein ACFSYJ_14490 [Amycolatopsis samaneae]|uniref:DUF3039 domain-containing protein n=2 Tax=Amycolatopsis samaneae TaxID=664691 RepID=A0ABW5GFA2_9PSEU
MIYLDPEKIHPGVDGVWHHTRLTCVPSPGDPITMLCGILAAAEFEQVDRRDTHGVPRTCWNCDYLYRHEHGIDIWPGHPAVPSRSAPHPRNRP